jgi:hypothetical protein
MKMPKSVVFALIAFLAAWQATEFDLDYRAILGALIAGLMGFMNPNTATSDQIASIFVKDQTKP